MSLSAFLAENALSVENVKFVASKRFLSDELDDKGKRKPMEWEIKAITGTEDEALVVRISQIESRLLGITGILDIANTTINEKAANHTLALDHIPVLGSLAPTTIEIKA